MSDTWYLKKDDKVFGPVSTADVSGYIKSGNITLDQVAATSETGPWNPLNSYDAFKESPGPIEEMFEKDDKSSVDQTPEISPNTEAPPLENSADGKGHLSEDLRETYRVNLIRYQKTRIYVYGILAFVFVFSLAVMPLGGWGALALGVVAFIVVYKKLDKSNKINGYSDQKLIYEFDMMKKETRNSNLGCGVLLLLLISVGGFYGYYLNKKPNCEVLSVTKTPEIFDIGGAPDAGYRVTATVKNKGDEGRIDMLATMTSSEGKATRKASYNFKNDETRAFYFDFHEPTITATNIKFLVQCTPPGKY